MRIKQKKYLRNAIINDRIGAVDITYAQKLMKK
jgi:hypothetical protein